MYSLCLFSEGNLYWKPQCAYFVTFYFKFKHLFHWSKFFIGVRFRCCDEEALGHLCTLDWRGITLYKSSKSTTLQSTLCPDIKSRREIFGFIGQEGKPEVAVFILKGSTWVNTAQPPQDEHQLFYTLCTCHLLRHPVYYTHTLHSRLQHKEVPSFLEYEDINQFFLLTKVRTGCWTYR